MACRTIKLDASGFLALLKGQKLDPFSGEVSFIDPEGAVKPFAPHYEEYIRPHVKGFEDKRIAALRRLRKNILYTIVLLIFLVLAGVAIVAWTTWDLDAKKNTIGFMSVIALLSVFVAYYPVLKYAADIKIEIFPHIFRFFGKDYAYSPGGGMDLPALAASGIIPGYNRKHTEDYVKGHYKDVSLELMEATLSQKSGSGKSQRTVIKFKGIFILLSMNKNFSGKTIVRRDAGSIGNWVSQKFSDLENVKLEDPVFEKQFECYASDQVEARYLLTTSFMERLLQLSELFGSKAIQCSFYDNRLLLMISSKENRFETGSIFEPATFVDDINTILREMQLIFQIIDILKLHQRTGL
ncbi:MAG: DUF3137 domain-containing protein [Alphaproteobacteria bacterium]